MKKELIANVLTFVVVLALGVSALAFGYMGIRPGTEYTRMTLQLPRSAQLVTGSSVLLRGVRIGEVERVDGDPRGVAVRLKFPTTHRIPQSSAVTIEQLSALGEPYVEFAPTGTDGPYFADGAVLGVDRVAVPTSIAEVFRSLADLSRIADVGPLSDLVKTAWQATTGTEQAMPALTQAGELLAATLMSRMPQIRRMFEQTQVYSRDLAWLGPAIAPVGPAFLDTMKAIRAALDRTLDMVMELGMPRPINDVAHPFLVRLDPYLSELIPKVAEILGPSLPIARAIDRTAPQVDLSAFLSSALALVGPDGAPRLSVTVPVPGGPAPATAGAPAPARMTAPGAKPSTPPSTTPR